MQTAWDLITARMSSGAHAFVASLPAVGAGLLALALFALAAMIAKSTTRRMLRRAGQDEHVALAVGRMVRWVIQGLGVLVSVTIIFPSLNAQTLMSTLGVGGVAIGFAFRDIFTNLLSGLLLLLTRPFRIGDQIISGTAEGTVEDITMRATLVRTPDHRRVLVPNAELFTGRVTVTTAYPRARASLNVLVPHPQDPARAIEVIEAALRGVDGVEHDVPPDAIAHEVTGEGVVLRVRYWVRPPSRGELALTRHTIILLLTRALREAGMGLATGVTVAFDPATSLVVTGRRDGAEGSADAS